jgi:hypothetical protein
MASTAGGCTSQAVEQMHLRLGRRHGVGAVVVMAVVGGGVGSALCAQLTYAWH